MDFISTKVHTINSKNSFKVCWREFSETKIKSTYNFVVYLSPAEMPRVARGIKKIRIKKLQLQKKISNFSASLVQPLAQL